VKRKGACIESHRGLIIMKSTQVGSRKETHREIKRLNTIKEALNLTSLK
jgi:hypothetical protein